MDIRRNFQERLKKALTIRKMKPIELSRKTNISKSLISLYMSGYAMPGLKNLMTISEALDVDIKWLLGYDVPME